jgi:hypothetical protein
MSATTITQIWQHKGSGETFAVKVYDGDNVREFMGPMYYGDVDQFIADVRAGEDWIGEVEEAERTNGYDAGQQMLAAFNETVGEYRTTWTEE